MTDLGRPRPVLRGVGAIVVATLAASLLLVGCAGDEEATPLDGQAGDPAELANRAEVSSEGDVGDPGDVGPRAPVSVGSDDEVVVGQATVGRVVAFERPDDRAAVVARLDHPTAIGGPLVFALVDPTPPPPSQEWVEVQLPVRPNGTTGWVRTAELSLSVNRYRIEIDVSEFQLRVLYRGELWLATEVAIGTGNTPTPRGDFYITELLQPPNPSGLYGPYAFGLSGYSETLTSFNGGDGVIGIHGTDEPDKLGTEVSHGCIRLANDVITELASVIPLGTPVRITD